MSTGGPRSPHPARTVDDLHRTCGFAEALRKRVMDAVLPQDAVGAEASLA
jgi:hypothetical protein